MDESQNLSANEMVISLYLPKLNHLHKKYRGVISTKVIKNWDAITQKLFEHLNEVQTGCTLEGFKVKCESLGFNRDTTSYMCGKFEKFLNMEDDDARSLFFRARNFFMNEAIKIAFEEYNSHREPDKLIEKISGLQMADLNNSFSDDQLYNTSFFEDLDLEKLESDFIKDPILSSLKIVNQSSPIGGYAKGQMVVFAAPPKCGKSLTAMQETVNFVKQGYNVVYSAFGDLKYIDFLYRMAAQINHRPMQYTMKNITTEVPIAIKNCPNIANGHLDLELLAPDEYTAAEYVEHIKNAYSVKDPTKTIHEWADIIIIDYDANLKSRFDDNMYKKGEDIYQTLYKLTYPNKLVILLSQTSKLAWDKECIELAELGESSRKQQILDMLITFSHPTSSNPGNHVGYMNLCAGRRLELKKCPYFRDVDGTMHEISEQTYGLIKIANNCKTFLKDIHLFSDDLSGNYDYLGSSLDNQPTFSPASILPEKKKEAAPVSDKENITDNDILSMLGVE